MRVLRPAPTALLASTFPKSLRFIFTFSFVLHWKQKRLRLTVPALLPGDKVGDKGGDKGTAYVSPGLLQ